MRNYLTRGGSVYSTINDQILLAMAKSKEMAELLMDKEPVGKKGLQIAYKDTYGYTPFLTQANSSRPEVMRAIFQRYPHVIAQKNIHGKNALHLCVLHAFPKSLECAEFLLEAKIDINAKTSGGYTALDIAVMSDNVATGSIIKLLIQKGIDTTLQKQSAGLPNAELVAKYLTYRNNAARIIQRGVKDHLQEAAWRPPNPNIPNNKGGKAYQNHLEKVKEAGHFQPRKSRKSRKTIKRKSRKQFKGRK